MAGTGSIGRVPIDGGAIEILADGLDEVGRIAIDATHLYLTTSDGEVRRVVRD